MPLRDPGLLPIKSLSLRGFFPILLLSNFCAAQINDNIFQDYGSRPPEEIVALFQNELASKDPLRGDNAVMFLSMLINAGENSRKEYDIILKLVENREVVCSASDIVAEHLAGWYEERDVAEERSMPLYYPLLYLLSFSRIKIAGTTLVMALPAAGFDAFFRKSLMSNEQASKSAFSRLPILESMLCCAYPGKELMSAMQAIDFRLNMLAMHLEGAGDSTSRFRSDDAEMKKFVLDCLAFGDGHRGRIVRTRALALACILIKAGQKDFLPAVRKLAESDPCYVYKILPAKNNRLPQYDIKSKYYPIREKAGKELLHLHL
jgi:hypothetical protein